MTQFAPLDPFSSDDRQGIPAADPGPGAPETAEGYGIPAEEPGEDGAGEAPRDVELPDDTPFSPPDPADVSRRGTADEG